MSDQTKPSTDGLIIFDLDNLPATIPVIPPSVGVFHALQCKVCLDSQGHADGVKLMVDLSYRETILHGQVRWAVDVSERERRATRDEKKTTDFGACVLALLFIDRFTEYTAYQQSATGDTIDYLLAPKGMLPQLLQEDTLIFNSPGKLPVAYLEVSGIRCENEYNTIASRISGKKRRLSTPEDLPTFIAIVEFGRPSAKMVKV